MEPVDDDFQALLRATFRAEAQEHVEALSARLLELEKTSAPARQSELVDEMFREAHSLKGAAGSVDAAEIGRVCQEMESVLSSWRSGEAAPTADGIDSVSTALDTILGLLESAAGAGPSGDISSAGGTEPSAEAGSPSDRGSVSAGIVAEPELIPAPAAVHEPAPAPAGTEAMIRVAENKIDELLLAAEELLTAKLATQRHAAAARELAADVAAWRKTWTAGRAALAEADSLSREDLRPIRELLDQTADVAAKLSSRTAALAAEAQQDRWTVDPLVDDLLAQVGRVVMLPFSSITGLFPKTVRDLARQQDKLADAVVRGGGTELDRRVLERLKDPLVHAIRNAVSHGIELPADREAKGKSRSGTVVIEASRLDGGKVSVTVSDDGRGLDAAKLRHSAMEAGLPAQTSGRLDDERAMALAFESGVSTSPNVTTISGRGVGLSVVKENIEELDGTVALDSAPGLGTTLRIVVPTTHATIHGVVVEVAGRPFVVPTARLNGVFRIPSGSVRTAASVPTTLIDGQVVPLVTLARILGLGPASHDESARNLQVFVLGSAVERVAFIVDRVVSEQPLLVKGLGPQLRTVANVSGATVLANGQVAPVLDQRGILAAASSITRGRQVAQVPEEEAEPQPEAVLVVEDSVTSRMLLRNILTTAGFDVRTACDGAEALTALKSEHFDLVVSDIQMPNMDGFDLTAAIRADPELKHLPVVLVTSLESPEDKARGLEVGASAYLVKRGFDQSNLLDTVRGLL